MRTHERDVSGVNARPILKDTGQAVAVFNNTNAATTTVFHKLGRIPTHISISEVGNFGPLGFNWMNPTDKQVTIILVSPTAITLNLPFSWAAFS